MPTLAGNEQLFLPSVSSQDAPFPSSDRKWTDLFRQRWTSKYLLLRGHIVHCLKSINHKWKKEKISVVRRSKKIKNIQCMTLNVWIIRKTKIIITLFFTSSILIAVH